MQKQIIQIIKKWVQPKGLVFPHKTEIHQRPIIGTVPKITLGENIFDMLAVADERIRDDGILVIHGLKRASQHK